MPSDDLNSPILLIPSDKEPESEKLTPPLDLQNTNLDNFITLLIKDKYTPKYSLSGLKKAVIIKEVFSPNYFDYSSNDELNKLVDNNISKIKYKCYVYGESGKFSVIPEAKDDYAAINHLNEFTPSGQKLDKASLSVGMIVAVDIKKRTIEYSYGKAINDVFTKTTSKSGLPNGSSAFKSVGPIPNPPPPPPLGNVPLDKLTSIFDTRAGRPVNPPIKGNYCIKDPKKLIEVMDQFSVETNPRYNRNIFRPVPPLGLEPPWGKDKKSKPNPPPPPPSGQVWGVYNTYCNIYVWDVCCAMGCRFFPYWTTSDNIDPKKIRIGSITKQQRTFVPNEPVNNDYILDWIYTKDDIWVHENNANDNTVWMKTYGPKWGWKILSGPEEAQKNANEGILTIGLRESKPSQTNGGNRGAGHVVAVRPDLEKKPYNPKFGPLLNQAGARCVSNAYHTAIGLGDPKAWLWASAICDDNTNTGG